MRRSPRTALALAVVMLLAVTPGIAHADRTIALSTGTFDYALSPGQAISDGLDVGNSADEGLTALVYSAMISADAEGEPVYTRPDPGSPDYLASPASWVRLRVPKDTQVIANTPYLDLAPDEVVRVDFDVLVPRNAAPGDYNIAVFFEMFDLESPDEGAASTISGRIGAHIKLRVVGDVRDSVEVDSFVVRPFVLGATTPFAANLNNAGNVDNPFAARVFLQSASGAEVWSQSLEETATLFAGTSRGYSGALEFDGVGLGRYTLVLEAAYDQESASGTSSLPATAVAERTIWIVPLWVAILVILLVGLPLLWVTWRASVRRETTRRERTSRKGRHADEDARRAAREARRRDLDNGLAPDDRPPVRLPED